MDPSIPALITPAGQSAQDLAAQNKIEAMGRRRIKPRYARMGVGYDEVSRAPEYK